MCSVPWQYNALSTLQVEASSDESSGGSTAETPGKQSSYSRPQLRECSVMPCNPFHAMLECDGSYIFEEVKEDKIGKVSRKTFPAVESRHSSTVHYFSITVQSRTREKQNSKQSDNKRQEFF